MLLEGKKLLVTGVLTRESIAYASAEALQEHGAEIVLTSFGRAIQTSAYSLKAIAAGMLPHMKGQGGAIVSLDFDAGDAWPIYDWMGVAKASLESITRYLARDLGPHGIRV